MRYKIEISFLNYPTLNFKHTFSDDLYKRITYY